MESEGRFLFHDNSLRIRKFGKLMNEMRFGVVKPYDDVMEEYHREGCDADYRNLQFQMGKVKYLGMPNGGKIVFQMTLEITEEDGELIYKGPNTETITGEDLEKGIRVIVCEKGDRKSLFHFEEIVNKGEDPANWVRFGEVYLRRKGLLIGNMCPWTGSLPNPDTLIKMREAGITQRELNAICSHVYRYDVVNLNPAVTIATADGRHKQVHWHVNRLDENLDGILAVKMAQITGREFIRRRFNIDRCVDLVDFFNGLTYRGGDKWISNFTHKQNVLDEKLYREQLTITSASSTGPDSRGNDNFTGRGTYKGVVLTPNWGTSSNRRFEDSGKGARSEEKDTGGLEAQMRALSFGKNDSDISTTTPQRWGTNRGEGLNTSSSSRSNELDPKEIIRNKREAVQKSLDAFVKARKDLGINIMTEEEQNKYNEERQNKKNQILDAIGKRMDRHAWEQYHRAVEGDWGLEFLQTLYLEFLEQDGLIKTQKGKLRWVSTGKEITNIGEAWEIKFEDEGWIQVPITNHKKGNYDEPIQYCPNVVPGMEGYTMGKKGEMNKISLDTSDQGRSKTRRVDPRRTRSVPYGKNKRRQIKSREYLEFDEDVRWYLGRGYVKTVLTVAQFFYKPKGGKRQLINLWDELSITGEAKAKVQTMKAPPGQDGVIPNPRKNGKGTKNRQTDTEDETGGQITKNFLRKGEGSRRKGYDSNNDTPKSQQRPVNQKVVQGVFNMVTRLQTKRGEGLNLSSEASSSAELGTGEVGIQRNAPPELKKRGRKPSTNVLMRSASSPATIEGENLVEDICHALKQAIDRDTKMEEAQSVMGQRNENDHNGVLASPSKRPKTGLFHDIVGFTPTPAKAREEGQGGNLMDTTCDQTGMGLSNMSTPIPVHMGRASIETQGSVQTVIRGDDMEIQPNQTQDVASSLIDRREEIQDAQRRDSIDEMLQINLEGEHNTEDTEENKKIRTWFLSGSVKDAGIDIQGDLDPAEENMRKIQWVNNHKRPRVFQRTMGSLTTSRLAFENQNTKRILLGELMASNIGIRTTPHNLIELYKETNDNVPIRISVEQILDKWEDWKQRLIQTRRDLYQQISDVMAQPSDLWQCRYVGVFHMGTTIKLGEHNNTTMGKWQTRMGILYTDVKEDPCITHHCLLTRQEVELFFNIKSKWVSLDYETAKLASKLFFRVMQRQGWGTFTSVQKLLTFLRRYDTSVVDVKSLCPTYKDRMWRLVWYMAYHGSKAIPIEKYGTKHLVEGMSIMGEISARLALWAEVETPIKITIKEGTNESILSAEEERDIMELCMMLPIRDIRIMQNKGITAPKVREALGLEYTPGEIVCVPTSRGNYYTRVTEEHKKFWWLMRNWSTGIITKAVDSNRIYPQFLMDRKIHEIALNEGFYSTYLLNMMWEREYTMIFHSKIASLGEDKKEWGLSLNDITDTRGMSIIEEIANQLLDYKLTYSPEGVWEAQPVIPKERSWDFQIAGLQTEVGSQSRYIRACSTEEIGIEKAVRRVGESIEDIEELEEGIRTVPLDIRKNAEDALAANLQITSQKARRIMIQIEKDMLCVKNNFLKGTRLEESITKHKTRIRQFGWCIYSGTNDNNLSERDEKGPVSEALYHMGEQILTDNMGIRDMEGREYENQIKQANSVRMGLFRQFLATRANIDMFYGKNITQARRIIFGKMGEMIRNEKRNWNEEFTPAFFDCCFKYEESVISLLTSIQQNYRRRIAQHHAHKMFSGEQRDWYVYARAIWRIAKRGIWLAFRLDITTGFYYGAPGLEFQGREVDRLHPGRVKRTILQHLEERGDTWGEREAWATSFLQRVDLMFHQCELADNEFKDTPEGTRWHRTSATTVTHIVREFMFNMYGVDIYTGTVITPYYNSRIAKEMKERQDMGELVESVRVGNMYDERMGGVDQMIERVRTHGLKIVPCTEFPDRYMDVLENMTETGLTLSEEDAMSSSDDSDSDDSDDSEDSDGGSTEGGKGDDERHMTEYDRDEGDDDYRSDITRNQDQFPPTKLESTNTRGSAPVVELIETTTSGVHFKVDKYQFFITPITVNDNQQEVWGIERVEDDNHKREIDNKYQNSYDISHLNEFTTITVHHLTDQNYQGGDQIQMKDHQEGEPFELVTSNKIIRIASDFFYRYKRGRDVEIHNSSTRASSQVTKANQEFQDQDELPDLTQDSDGESPSPQKKISQAKGGNQGDSSSSSSSSSSSASASSTTNQKASPTKPGQQNWSKRLGKMGDPETIQTLAYQHNMLKNVECPFFELKFNPHGLSDKCILVLRLFWYLDMYRLTVMEVLDSIRIKQGIDVNANTLAQFHNITPHKYEWASKSLDRWDRMKSEMGMSVSWITEPDQDEKGIIDFPVDRRNQLALEINQGALAILQGKWIENEELQKVLMLLRCPFTRRMEHYIRKYFTVQVNPGEQEIQPEGFWITDIWLKADVNNTKPNGKLVFNYLLGIKDVLMLTNLLQGVTAEWIMQIETQFAINIPIVEEMMRGLKNKDPTKWLYMRNLIVNKIEGKGTLSMLTDPNGMMQLTEGVMISKTAPVLPGHFFQVGRGVKMIPHIKGFKDYHEISISQMETDIKDAINDICDLEDYERIGQTNIYNYESAFNGGFDHGEQGYYDWLQDFDYDDNAKYPYRGEYLNTLWYRQEMVTKVVRVRPVYKPMIGRPDFKIIVIPRELQRDLYDKLGDVWRCLRVRAPIDVKIKQVTFEDIYDGKTIHIKNAWGDAYLEIRKVMHRNGLGERTWWDFYQEKGIDERDMLRERCLSVIELWIDIVARETTLHNIELPRSLNFQNQNQPFSGFMNRGNRKFHLGMAALRCRHHNLDYKGKQDINPAVEDTKKLLTIQMGIPNPFALPTDTPLNFQIVMSLNTIYIFHWVWTMIQRGSRYKLRQHWRHQKAPHYVRLLEGNWAGEFYRVHQGHLAMLEFVLRMGIKQDSNTKYRGERVFKQLRHAVDGPSVLYVIQTILRIVIKPFVLHQRRQFMELWIPIVQNSGPNDTFVSYEETKRTNDDLRHCGEYCEIPGLSNLQNLTSSRAEENGINFYEEQMGTVPARGKKTRCWWGTTRMWIGIGNPMSICRAMDTYPLAYREGATETGFYYKLSIHKFDDKNHQFTERGLHNDSIRNNQSRTEVGHLETQDYYIDSNIYNTTAWAEDRTSVYEEPGEHVEDIWKILYSLRFSGDMRTRQQNRPLYLNHLKGREMGTFLKYNNESRNTPSTLNSQRQLLGDIEFESYQNAIWEREIVGTTQNAKYPFIYYDYDKELGTLGFLTTYRIEGYTAMIDSPFDKYFTAGGRGNIVTNPKGIDMGTNQIEELTEDEAPTTQPDANSTVVVTPQIQPTSGTTGLGNVSNGNDGTSNSQSSQIIPLGAGINNNVTLPNTGGIAGGDTSSTGVMPITGGSTTHGTIPTSITVGTTMGINNNTAPINTGGIDGGNMSSIGVTPIPGGSDTHGARPTSPTAGKARGVNNKIKILANNDKRSGNDQTLLTPAPKNHNGQSNSEVSAAPASSGGGDNNTPERWSASIIQAIQPYWDGWEIVNGQYRGYSQISDDYLKILSKQSNKPPLPTIANFGGIKESFFQFRDTRLLTFDEIGETELEYINYTRPCKITEITMIGEHQIQNNSTSFWKHDIDDKQPIPSPPTVISEIRQYIDNKGVGFQSNEHKSPGGLGLDKLMGELRLQQTPERNPSNKTSVQQDQNTQDSRGDKRESGNKDKKENRRKRNKDETCKGVWKPSKRDDRDDEDDQDNLDQTRQGGEGKFKGVSAYSGGHRSSFKGGSQLRQYKPKTRKLNNLDEDVVITSEVIHIADTKKTRIPFGRGLMYLTNRNQGIRSPDSTPRLQDECVTSPMSFTDDKKGGMEHDGERFRNSQTAQDKTEPNSKGNYTDLFCTSEEEKGTMCQTVDKKTPVKELEKGSKETSAMTTSQPPVIATLQTIKYIKDQAKQLPVGDVVRQLIAGLQRFQEEEREESEGTQEKAPSMTQMETQERNDKKAQENHKDLFDSHTGELIQESIRKERESKNLNDIWFHKMKIARETEQKYQHNLSDAKNTQEEMERQVRDDLRHVQGVKMATILSDIDPFNRGIWARQRGQQNKQGEHDQVKLLDQGNSSKNQMEIERVQEGHDVTDASTTAPTQNKTENREQEEDEIAVEYEEEEEINGYENLQKGNIEIGGNIIQLDDNEIQGKEGEEIDEINSESRIEGNLGEETEWITISNVQNKWWGDRYDSSTKPQDFKRDKEILNMRQDTLISLMKEAKERERERFLFSDAREKYFHKRWFNWPEQYRWNHLETKICALLLATTIFDDPQYGFRQDRIVNRDTFVKALRVLQTGEGLFAKQWLKLQMTEEPIEVIKKRRGEFLTGEKLQRLYHTPSKNFYEYVESIKKNTHGGVGELSMIDAQYHVKVFIFSCHSGSELDWDERFPDKQRGYRVTEPITEFELMMRRLEGEVYLPINGRIYREFRDALILWSLLTDKDVAYYEEVIRILVEAANATDRLGWSTVTGLNVIKRIELKQIINDDTAYKWQLRRRDVYMIILQIVTKMGGSSERKGTVNYNQSMSQFLLGRNGEIDQMGDSFLWQKDLPGEQYALTQADSLQTFIQKVKVFRDAISFSRDMEYIEERTRWMWQKRDFGQNGNEIDKYYDKATFTPILYQRECLGNNINFLWYFMVDQYWQFWKEVSEKFPSITARGAFSFWDTPRENMVIRRNIMRTVSVIHLPELSFIISLLLSITKSVFAQRPEVDYFGVGRAWWTGYVMTVPKGKATKWANFIERFDGEHSDTPINPKVILLDGDSDEKCNRLWKMSYGHTGGVLNYLPTTKLSSYSCRRLMLMARVASFDLRYPEEFELLTESQQRLMSRNRINGRLNMIKKNSKVGSQGGIHSPGTSPTSNSNYTFGKQADIPPHEDLRYRGAPQVPQPTILHVSGGGYLSHQRSNSRVILKKNTDIVTNEYLADNTVEDNGGQQDQEDEQGSIQLSPLPENHDQNYVDGLEQDNQGEHSNQGSPLPEETKPDPVIDEDNRINHIMGLLDNDIQNIVSVFIEDITTINDENAEVLGKAILKKGDVALGHSFLQALVEQQKRCKSESLKLALQQHHEESVYVNTKAIHIGFFHDKVKSIVSTSPLFHDGKMGGKVTLHPRESITKVGAPPSYHSTTNDMVSPNHLGVTATIGEGSTGRSHDRSVYIAQPKAHMYSHSNPPQIAKRDVRLDGGSRNTHDEVPLHHRGIGEKVYEDRRQREVSRVFPDGQHFNEEGYKEVRYNTKGETDSARGIPKGVPGGRWESSREVSTNNNTWTNIHPALYKLQLGWYVVQVNASFVNLDQHELDALEGPQWSQAFGIKVDHLNTMRDDLPILNQPATEIIQWGYIPYYQATIRRMFCINRMKAHLPIHQDTRLTVLNYGDFEQIKLGSGGVLFHTWRPYVQCDTTVDDFMVKSIIDVPDKANSIDYINRRYEKGSNRRATKIEETHKELIKIFDEDETDWDLEPDLLHNLVESYIDMAGRDRIGAPSVLELKACFHAIIPRWVSYEQTTGGKSRMFTSFLRKTVQEAFKMLTSESHREEWTLRTQQTRLWVWVALSHPREGFFMSVLAALGNKLYCKEPTEHLESRMYIRNMYIGLCAGTMHMAQLLMKTDPNRYGLDSAITRLMLISRIFKVLDPVMVYRESKLLTGISEARTSQLLIGFDLLVLLNALTDMKMELARQEIIRELARTDPIGEDDWPWDEPTQYPRGRGMSRSHHIDRLVVLYQQGRINSIRSSRLNNQQTRLPEGVDIRPYIGLALQSVAVTMEMVPGSNMGSVPVMHWIDTIVRLIPYQGEVQKQLLPRYTSLAMAIYYTPTISPDRWFRDGWSTAHGVDSFDLLKGLWKRMGALQSIWRKSFLVIFEKSKDTKREDRITQYNTMMERLYKYELNEQPQSVKSLKRFDVQKEGNECDIKLNLVGGRDHWGTNRDSSVESSKGSERKKGSYSKGKDEKYPFEKRNTGDNQVRGRSRERQQATLEKHISWVPPDFQNKDKESKRKENYDTTSVIIDKLFKIIGITTEDKLNITNNKIGRRDIGWDRRNITSGNQILRGGSWTLSCGPPLICEAPNKVLDTLFKGFENLMGDLSMNHRVLVDELFVSRAQVLGIWPPCYVWRKSLGKQTSERRFCVKPFCPYLHVDVGTAQGNQSRPRYVSRGQGLGMILNMEGPEWEKHWKKDDKGQNIVPSSRLRKVMAYLNWLLNEIEVKGKRGGTINLTSTSQTAPYIFGEKTMDGTLFWKWNMARFATLFPQSMAHHINVLVSDAQWVKNAKEVEEVTSWFTSLRAAPRSRDNSRFSSLSGKTLHPNKFLSSAKRPSLASIQSFRTNYSNKSDKANESFSGRVRAICGRGEINDIIGNVHDYDELQERLQHSIELSSLRRHYFENGKVEMTDTVYKEADDMIVMDTGASWTVMTEKFADIYLPDFNRITLEHGIRIKVADETTYKCKQAIDLTYKIPIFRQEGNPWTTHYMTGGWEDCNLEEDGYLRITDRVYILPVQCLQPILWGAVITERLRCVIDCDSGRVKIKTPKGYRVIQWGRNEYRLWQMPFIHEGPNETKAPWQGELIRQQHNNNHLIMSRPRIQISRRNVINEFESLGAVMISQIQKPGWDILKGDLNQSNGYALTEWDKSNIIRLREIMEGLEKDRNVLMHKLNEHNIVLGEVHQTLLDIRAEKAGTDNIKILATHGGRTAVSPSGNTFGNDGTNEIQGLSGGTEGKGDTFSTPDKSGDTNSEDTKQRELTDVCTIERTGNHREKTGEGTKVIISRKKIKVRRSRSEPDRASDSELSSDEKRHVTPIFNFQRGVEKSGI